MKLLIPKQHGAWAMLIVPFIIGGYYGGFTLLHIPLAIAWLAIYLSSYPMMMAMKKKRLDYYLSWVKRYLIMAVIFILPVIIIEPFIIVIGLFLVPFFLLNISFAQKNKDRSFWNDLIAIMAFSVSGIATYFLGYGELTNMAYIVWLFSVLFFTGSLFFVKSKIREKKNPAFRWTSWIYHIMVVVGAFVISGIVALAFLPSLLRAIIFSGKKMTPKQIGILEISNAVLFVLFITGGNSF